MTTDADSSPIPGLAPYDPARDPVGQPLDRVDGRLKVTGGARYAAEYPVQDLVHGVLIQSTIAKGRIVEIDSSAAEALPGVLLVMTHLNAPRVSEEKPGSGDRKLFLLQEPRVYFNRQHIALVVAETLEQATHAASLVRVRYEAEKPIVELRPGLPEVLPAQGSEPSRGNLDAGFLAAVERVQSIYSSPVENHNPMEPHATTAVWDGDHLTLYDSTQGIFQVQKRVAGTLGIPPANVRVVCYFTGGGFGCKGSTWSHVLLTAMAARKVNRPVRLALERPQMYGPVGFRPHTVQELGVGADPAGLLTAIRHHSVNQISTFDEYDERTSPFVRSLYVCPNVDTATHLVKLDAGTPTYMRAPGESTGSFALESAMDELSYTVGVDPLELRLRNYAETDPDNGLPWSSKSLRECYRQGAERFGWSQRNPKPRSTRRDGMLVGWGMASASYPAHRSRAAARARILPDGTAVVRSGSQDLGTGTYTVMTQVAARALGLPVEKVRFELGDTDMPESPNSGGSQTAASLGSAVQKAAAAVRDNAIALAVADTRSPLFGKSPDDVGAGNGNLFLKGDPAQSESYAGLLTRHGLPMIEAVGDARPGRELKQYAMRSFGAQFAEVLVDPDLGQVRVARWVGAFAAGHILNAKTGRSQLMGGIIFGLGMALMEHTLTDSRTGRIMNADLAEYHLPVNADVPDIDIIMVDEDDPYVNPIGIKGIGEIGITGVAAAVANAVFHATGKRIRDLPITLDKLI